MNRWTMQTLHVQCPLDNSKAKVQVDARTDGADEMLGIGAPYVVRCSKRGPGETCQETCFPQRTPTQGLNGSDDTLPLTEWRPVVLVPLDGSRGSEAVLPTAQDIALERGARIRLLHVVPPVESARAIEDRMIAYADQESARVVDEVRGYLRGPRGALTNVDVEEVVRFGVPAEEILREAEARDVVAIVMAAHRQTWLRRLLRRSISRRVERAAWVPVMRTRYGAETCHAEEGTVPSHSEQRRT